ncbi:MAG: prevent-host-death protein [Anaerolineae bacterium SG8_19]|jgi:prevent-host-death family protein|nr:MAG: prevent-host-death protein [Anaerolineae bacterium SG8_19]HCB49149.1 type II toxin-antitoxin system prevent-host-death family antitoxin [Chloroflexota bacterium]
MEKVGAYEAKTHLPKLLERAAKGHRITITKHGVPVAVLGPYDPEKSVDIEVVIRQLYEFRENNSLSGLTIREMIEEGRR